MSRYQLTKGDSVIRLDDTALIPADPHNVDWQGYLAWLAAGNVPAPVATPIVPTTIPAAAFYARFTPAEQLAVQTAANASPQLGLGMTLGLAQGFVIFASPLLINWMNGMVAAGAITRARAAVIMTP
jgi:hypothetical protein